MGTKQQLLWAVGIVLIIVAIAVTVSTLPKPDVCPNDSRCSAVLTQLKTDAAKYPDINPGTMTNSIASGVIRNCSGGRLSECAGFLPYICSKGGATDFCAKSKPAPSWCVNPSAGPPDGASGIPCSAIRR